MQQFQSNPFSEIDYEDDRPTWPPAGSAKLVIVDKYEALFFTATWTIVASVGEEVLAMTKASNQPHTGPYIRRWSREMIRQNYSYLRSLGVDAEGEYERLGGLEEDLEK